MRAVKRLTVPPSSASRSDRRRAATTEQLLHAALELFALHGFDGTTMEMIAERADVARTTVFNYFTRKDALLLAALAERRRAVGDRLARSAAATNLTTQDRIRDAVTGWAGAYQADAVVGAGLVRAWVQAGGPYLPGSTDTATLFAEALRVGQTRGEVRPDIDVHVAGLALLDVGVGTLVRWAQQPRTRSRSRLGPAMLSATDTVMNGLLIDDPRATELRRASKAARRKTSPRSSG